MRNHLPQRSYLAKGMLKGLRDRAIFPIAVLVLLFTASYLFAQQSPPAITAQDQDILRVLAAHVSNSDRVETALAELGFPPQGFVKGPAEGYKRWPALRKLEAAYLSTVEAKGPEYGNRFLRVLSRSIATNQTNAIRHEKSLHEFFPEARNTPIKELPTKFDFSLVKKSVQVQASPELKNVLMTLERYTGAIPGGMQSVMAACCPLNQQQIYDILRTSESSGDAMLASLINSGVPPELREKIRRMIRHVAERSNAFKYESIFKPYIDPNNPIKFKPENEVVTKPGINTSHDKDFDEAISRLISDAAKSSTLSEGAQRNLTPTPSVSVSRGEADGGGNIQRYRAAQNSIELPSGLKPIAPGRIPFRGMARGGGGFGGVVFGNDVRLKVGPKLVEIQWVPDSIESNSAGSFDFHFADGSTGYSGKFPEHLAYAAKLLVYDGFGREFPPLNVSANEGVGLAGVAAAAGGRKVTGLSYPVIYEGNAFTVEAKRFIVHPAIDGLPLGYAAVQADALSFMPSTAWFVRELRKAGASEKIAEKAEDWQDDQDRGFFKITDAQLEISRRVDGYIEIARQPTKGFNDDHRKVALITTQTFTESLKEDLADDEFKTPFYEIVPALTQTFDAFNQLNQFAEVFAIVRWAKRENAKWLGNVAEPRRGPSLTNVLRRPDGGLALTEEVFETTAYYQKFIEDVRNYTTDKAQYPTLSQKGYDVASELSTHRLNQLKFTLAAEQLRKLKVTDPKDGKPRLDAIKSLEENAAKEYLIEIEKIKSLEKEDLGLASPSDLEHLARMGELVEKLTTEDDELDDKINELQSISHRINNAPTNIKTKAEALRAKRSELIDKSWSTGSAKIEANLTKTIKQIEEDLHRLLPLDSKRINDLETEINRVETERSKALSDMENLIRGPLKSWNEFKRIQHQATSVFKDALRNR